MELDKMSVFSCTDNTNSIRSSIFKDWYEKAKGDGVFDYIDYSTQDKFYDSLCAFYNKKEISILRNLISVMFDGNKCDYELVCSVASQLENRSDHDVTFNNVIQYTTISPICDMITTDGFTYDKLYSITDKYILTDLAKCCKIVDNFEDALDMIDLGIDAKLYDTFSKVKGYVDIDVYNKSDDKKRYLDNLNILYASEFRDIVSSIGFMYPSAVFCALFFKKCGVCIDKVLCDSPESHSDDFWLKVVLLESDGFLTNDKTEITENVYKTLMRFYAYLKCDDLRYLHPYLEWMLSETDRIKNNTNVENPCILTTSDKTLYKNTIYLARGKRTYNYFRDSVPYLVDDVKYVLNMYSKDIIDLFKQNERNGSSVIFLEKYNDDSKLNLVRYRVNKLTDLMYITDVIGFGKIFSVIENIGKKIGIYEPNICILIFLVNKFGFNAKEYVVFARKNPALAISTLLTIICMYKKGTIYHERVLASPCKYTMFMNNISLYTSANININASIIMMLCFELSFTLNDNGVFNKHVSDEFIIEHDGMKTLHNVNEIVVEDNMYTLNKFNFTRKYRTCMRKHVNASKDCENRICLEVIS